MNIIIKKSRNMSANTNRF